jgi:hypothetical protein
MMMSDEPRFEVEINYTKAMCHSITSSYFFKKLVLLCLYYLLVLVAVYCFILSLVKTHTIDYIFMGEVIWLIIIPIIIYNIRVAQLYDSLKMWGLGKTLVLTSENVSWQWKHNIATTTVWSTFYRLQKTKKIWLLYLDKKLSLFLPTDQLPPEAQAFILKKLTEHNVPIKG